MKIADFLSKYKLILFDMDGVITSEQRYWDSSALAVYQMLHDGEELDFNALHRRVGKVRQEVFCNDRTISFLKEKGVNSNWDLTYVVYTAAKRLGTKDFEKIYEFLKSLDLNALELYGYLGGRGGEDYQRGIRLFQEWYLGEGGKPALMEGEEPILPADTTYQIMKALHQSGITIGIGTGRVRYEIDQPLKGWDILQFFKPEHCVTYTEVMQAEAEVDGVTLTKPHPYMFLKGMLGLGYDNKKIVNGDFDRALAKQVLVVGDAGADILSAQAAGMDFAAVLTGVSGEKARGYFESLGAQYILPSILGLVTEE